MNIGGINVLPPPFNGNFNPLSIAIQGNSIFTGNGDGLTISNVNVLDVENNQIQLPVGFLGTPIFLVNCSGYSCSHNVTDGGDVGIRALGALPTTTGVITENTIRNCRAGGIGLSQTVPIPTPGTIQIIANQFGECGLASLAAVIQMTSNVSPDTIQVVNNVYFGHVNNLTRFIQSGQHLNIVNGNYQTQTALPDEIP